MAETDFPGDLLEKSPLERLEYFRAYTIAHPILKEVYTKLIRAIKEPAGTALIFIYGATGVGKTTLRLRAEKQLREDYQKNIESKPGVIPVVGVEAVAPDSGNFSWKDFYKRALLTMEEPLIDYKINYGGQKIFRNDEGQLRINQRTVVTELRYALESALKFRHPNALLIDEAQHIAKIPSGRKLQDQMDSLKSLANLSGTILVLLGTYELLEARNLSAQLSRRSLDIHFRRYFINSQDDIQAFQNIIYVFQRHLPLPQEPDLVKHWRFLYERSLGCVGILKDWLTRSLAAALEEDAAIITLKHLEQQAISLARCKKVMEEIAYGEAQLSEKEEDRNKLRLLLGFNDELKIESSNTARTPTTRQKKVRAAGRRNPKRDGII